MNIISIYIDMYMYKYRYVKCIYVYTWMRTLKTMEAYGLNITNSV